MRSEQEMLDLILDTARSDDRIRAVILNGSRANPNAPRDFFQDFDVVYIVTDPLPFRSNLEWIRRFGERMILQLPDEMHDPPPPDHEGFAYLMQFADGNRIDLGIYPIAQLAERTRDSLSVALLDKDGIVPPLPPPNEGDYLPKPPTAKQFFDCCNEFWWCCPYAAKGLWRREIPYAKQMADAYVREELMKMLRWHLGAKTGFSVNPGKLGKHFEQYLEPELWELFLRTYSDADYDRTWDTLFAMGDLFRIAAMRVAEHFGYEYPHDDDRSVTAHLRRVRGLPRDAREMY